MYKLMDKLGFLVIIEKRAENMVGRDAKPLADQDQRRSRDPVGALLVSLQLLECDPELRQALPGTCSAAAGIPECGRLSLDQCPWSGLSNSVSCSPFHCSKFRILPSIDPRLGSSSTREPRILGRPGGGSDEEAGRIEALGKAAAHHLEHSPSLNAASAFALARNPFIRPFWRYRWLRQQLAMSILLSIRLATIIRQLLQQADTKPLSEWVSDGRKILENRASHVSALCVSGACPGSSGSLLRH